MPIYEYKCCKCGHEFDRIMKMGDPNPVCPCGEDDDATETCGSETEKLISRSSFQLKGTGWYATDYGTKS